ncbi:MAG: hypothetical protein JXJ04_11620 [Spirochaetales bacterium]|nr:hypothetical protein [Spirochaetales bacterium]
MEIKSKGYDYFDVERNLQIAVDDGKVIRVISYAMSSDVENTLDKIVSRILDKYSRPDLKSLVYTCTKELAINGTKANLKRIFFLENGLDITVEKDYEKGMDLYKNNMREEITLQYGVKAKQQGLFVKISFVHNEEVLKIEVTNNTGITKQEEKRLREKLKKTMKYDDLMQYYLDNSDDTEGSGMGIALIIILLKGEKIDPNLFRMCINENLTTAKIEIPMSEAYVNQREIHSNAKTKKE